MSLSLYYNVIFVGVLAWFLISELRGLTNVTRPLAYAAILLATGLFCTFSTGRTLPAALIPTGFGVIILVRRALIRK